MRRREFLISSAFATSGLWSYLGNGGSAFALELPEGGVEIDKPASAEIEEPSELVYSPGAGGLPGRQLQYQYLEALSISDASGDDWALKHNTGRFYGLQEVPARDVTCRYTGHKHRYDLIVQDRGTGELAVIKGTDRRVDPEEYRPATPGGADALYSAYVTYEGVELLPVHLYSGGWARKYAAQRAEWLDYCRSSLTRTFDRAEQGKPIRLIGYGDSTTAMGGTNYRQPNLNTDRRAFFERYPEDTLSRFETFEAGDPGFGGDIEAPRVKVNWNWHLKAAIEERYGAPVDYRNWGIGGTTSGNREGRPDGRFPERLQAMLADDGDLMVLGFGMNELGTAHTYENAKAIIEAFQAKGGEVIVMPPCQINKWGHRTTQARWQKTQSALLRAAKATGSAYVPVQMMDAVEFPGATGLSWQNLTNSNLYNHPGPAQFATLATMLTSILPR